MTSLIIGVGCVALVVGMLVGVALGHGRSWRMGYEDGRRSMLPGRFRSLTKEDAARSTP